MILWLGKEGVFHVVGKDIQNVFQNLFKQRGKWRREVRKYVTKYYMADAPRAVSKEKAVVCMVDGRMHHGGLGDRLRGIVSVYSVCKRLGIDFKIYFVSPFQLDTFFTPNDVHWKISKEELCYNTADAFPLFCGTNGTHVERPFQRRWFVKNFKCNVKQIHVYTNAILLRSAEFQRHFNELFTLSPLLRNAVDTVHKDIGRIYIGVTCRFQQLLGDFEEGNYETLSAKAQDALMDDAGREIEKIFQSHKKPMLLTSDSIRFLQYMSDRADYVYTIPGNLVHMDYSDKSDTQLHLKSFTDLMALSGAEKIYLLKSPKMYNSGFPRIAALIGNKPFKLIRFGY